MPIKFRCPHCKQFLGISRAKAGSITDCPTCGHSIRIPALDGRVAPLPAPKLDLKDDKLVEALGALAAFEDEPAAACAPAAGPARPRSAAVVPEVVPQEYLELEVVAEPVPNVEDASEFSVVGEEDVLAQLRTIPAKLEESKPARRTGPQFGAAVLLLACVGSAACGGIIGWGFTRGYWATRVASAPSAAVPAAPAPQAAAPAPAPAAASGVHVDGVITYAAPGGDWRADKGARVLLLPLKRQGGGKISANGFRVGATEADRKLLAASAEALGGVLVLADEQGKFVAPLPDRGEYGMIAASRYQSRMESLPLPGACKDFLGMYFDRAEQVIGNVQFLYREISVDAAAPVTLKIEFDAN